MNRPLCVLGLLASLALACGGYQPNFNQKFPNPDEGTVDYTVLSTAPLPPDPRGATPTICGSKRCYFAISAKAEAQPITLFAFDQTSTGGKAPSPIAASAITATEYDFPSGCSASGDYDAVSDAFHPNLQYPVFDTLPVSGSATDGLVTSSKVGGLGAYACNDFKTADSIGGAPGVTQGDDGAMAGARSGVFFRPVVDATSPVKPSFNSLFAPLSGWYANLQLAYLDGGPVPVDGSGNLVAMDAALLDPVDGTQSGITDANVLVLPRRPGEAGFSPYVALHEFTVPAGKLASDYNAICTTPGNCRPNEIDPSKWKSTPTLTLLIVASP